MFRHLPPSWWYLHYLPRPGASHPLDAGLRSRRLAGAYGAPRGRRSGSPSIRATEQAKYRQACAATPSTSLIPIGVETFGGVGPGAQDFVKTLLRLRSARLPHVDQDDYAAARVGHYYVQRLVVALLRSQAHLLRRRAVWKSQANDIALPSDCHHAAGFLRRRDGVLGGADAVYVSLPPLVQV